MQLQIPLGQYPGRGQATLPVTLNYSSKVWNIKHQSTSPCNGEPVTSYRTEFAKGSASGWTSTLGWFLPSKDLSLELYEGITGKPAQQGNPTLFRIMRGFVRLPDGSRHEVRKDDARHDLGDSLFGMYYAVDGSRIMHDLATNTTFLPDGSRIVGDGSGSIQYSDRNGNFMNYTSGTWTDTLGRTFGVPIPGTAPAAGDVVYTLPGGLTYTFRWRNLADALTDPTQPLRFPGDAPSANCTLGSPQPGTLFSTQDANNKILKGVLFNPVVLWQISLPNSTNYTFTYNVYGEMDKIVYPTSGSEEFTYGVWEPLGGHLDDGTYSQANRGVNSRVVSDGVTSPQVWTYGGNNFEPGVDPATDVRIVTAPNGTVTKTWYYISRGTQIKYGFDDARTGMVREERVYNSSGAMLRRTVNQLVMDGPQPGGYQTATRNARVTKTVEIILDTGGNALASATEMTYDADLNVTSTKQYNFVEISQATAQTGDLGAIPNGTLVRTQETDYLTGDANYRARNLLSLPIAAQVKNGLGNIVTQSSIAYDESAFPLLTYGSLTGWSDPGVSARGNVTSSSVWLNTTGANLSSHMQYDQCGNVRKVWDARDTSLTNPAQIEYSAAYQRAYPTLNTSPDPDAGGPLVALVTSTEYDGATGLVTSTIDANGQQTTFSYNDPLLRLKQVIRAVGDATVKNQTTYIYDDAGRTVTVTSDLNNFEDNILKSVMFYDALGRRVESRSYEGGTNFIASQTQYDTMGRANKSSNPFRPWLGESAVWTTTVFDALSRVLTVTTPDNAVVATSYSGNTVTVTDQVGKKRKSVTDALGRLTEVYEDPLGLNYQTSYGYDVLDNLTTVTQHTQTRTFVYDSLKRLTSATNPESGTINYQYDSNGNLTQKTDARGISITYVYDALNRNTTVDYSNTTLINPDITRIYDSGANGKGRLRESYAGGTETVGANVEHTKIISYDALGRPQEQRQRFKTNNVWSAEYKVLRGYNRAGGVTSQTYPSERIASYAYDDAGRTSGFTGNLGDGTQRTYSTGIIYSSLGGMTKEQFGTDTPLYNKSFYTSRGQLAEIRVGITYTGPTDSGWERGAIINHYSGECWGACGGLNMTDNNGNLRQQDHWIPDGSGGVQGLFVQSYTYDSLNRLQRVTEGSNWQQEYVYDRWGNRTIHQTNTFGLGINKKPFLVNTGNNQLGVPAGQSGTMSYDATGNLTNDTYTGIGDRVYDAENRMTKAWGGNNQWQEYIYNADGQRTRRKLDAQETWQVYGMDGELLAEYAALAAPSSPQKEYGYRNGQLLITAETPSGQAPPLNVQNVNWTNVSSTVTATGNGIQKMSGTNAWDSGAVSTQTIASGNGYVDFTPGEAVTWRMCGLGNGDSSAFYSDIEFAFFMDGGGGLSIYESGNLRGSFGSYAASDHLKVAVENGVVKYYRNGTLLYTSTVTPQYPLLVDTSLNTVNSGVYNVVLANNVQNVAWTNVSSAVTATGNGVQKMSGTNAWDSGAVSTQTIASGNGYVDFTPGEAVTWRMCGLGNGDSSAFYTDIEFAFFMDGGGGLSIYESGNLRGSFGSYAASDHLKVAVENGVVKYYRNGELLYTSTVTPQYPLLVDTSLNTVYSGVYNVVITSTTPSSSANLQWLVTDQLGTPRMIFDKTGALANVKRHDYLPFGEELFAGVGGRTPQLGYSSGDGVRQQFTSKERDNETNLDYSGARYYASTQGRFTSADPLFIEMKRLPHPQAWNLYSYTRNNPLKYVDDDGMEVRVDCGASDGKNFKQCVEQTTTDLNNRKGSQFKTEIKDGKLGVVGNVDVSTLSKSEAALYNAITDTNNIATLTMQMPGVASGDIMFDQHNGRGSNTVDRADLNQLNKLDKSLGGEVIAHAAMEAYVGVAEGLGTYREAHARANEFFGDVKVGGLEGLPAGAAMATSGRAVYDFRRVGTKATVEKTFFTPQPAQSLPNNWERTQGNIKVIMPSQEKKR